MKRKPPLSPLRDPERHRRRTEDHLRISHLRREVKTALELAVAALAHAEVIDQLATAAGLLEALNEFPRSSAPVLATLPRASELAEQSLLAWREWQALPARRRSA
jgi:Tfp pilus assembly protein PilX